MKHQSPDYRLPAPDSRAGAAMAITLAALLAVTLVAGALVKSLLLSHRQSQRYSAELQAQWLAEAGLARARAQLAAAADYTGETWSAAVGDQDDAGRVVIRIEPAAGDSPRMLVVEAVYPPGEHQGVLVRRQSPLPAAGASP